MFYTNPDSRGRIVRWLLEEIGVPYETRVIKYGEVMKAPEYLAINPMGKVPALRHGDQIITETPAICVYLAEVFSEAGLKPDPAYLGAYYRWFFFVAGPIEAAIADHLLGVTVPAEAEEAVGYANYDLASSVLEKHLGANEYAAGPRFSAADVYIGSHVYFSMVTKQLDARPALRRYFERVTDRDAFRRVSDFDGVITKTIE